jgi:SAM-dependent methyltransferase
MGYRNVDGFDFSPMALHFCRRRGLESVQQGSITDIPHAEGSYDVVISCDVLNDANIEDENLALRELYRVLKPGGRLFLNLPAFGFLRGEHDQATSVVRRYTKGGISRQLRDAGFKVRRVTYWNMLLFPAVLAVRHLRSGRSGDPEKPARSDIVLPPAPINTLLTLIVRLERLLLRKINLPLGSSVAVVAVKPRQARGGSRPG